MKLLTIGEHFSLSDKIGFCGYNSVALTLDIKLKQYADAEIHRIIFNREVKELNKENEVIIPSDKIYEYLQNNDYITFYGHYFDRWAESKIRSSSQQKIPIVSFAHDLISSYTQIKNLILDTSHSNIDSIIVPTNAGRQAIQGYLDYIFDRYKINFKGFIETIPYGIDTEKLYPLDKKFAREQLSLNIHNRYILFVGRFSKTYKIDILPLLLTFRIITKCQDFNDVRLILAGSTKDNYLESLKTTLEELEIRNKVILFPNFLEQDKNYIYNSSDIFISLSDHPQETFGVAPLEAMATGIPLILSDWDGYKELVTEGVNGFKIPTYLCKEMIDNKLIDSIGGYSKSVAIDTKVLKECLTALLKDKEKRNLLGKYGMRIARNKFDWKIVIEKLVKHFKKLKTLANKNPIFQEIEEPSVSKIFEHYPTSFINLKELEQEIIVKNGDNYTMKVITKLKKEVTDEKFLQFILFKYGIRDFY